jgi:hypothetical protein
VLSAGTGLVAGIAVAAAVAMAGCTPGSRPSAASGTTPPASTVTSPPPAVSSPMTSPPDPREPMARLHGTPLPARTGLRLLVAADPPVVVDIDSGLRRPVTGLPGRKDRILWLQPVGPDAVISSTCLACGPNAELFVLRHGSTAARRLGTAAQVAPSLDGRGVWLTSYRDPRHCALAEIGLDGRERRPARPIDCRLHPRTETPLGLLVSVAPADEAMPGSDAILTPGDGHPVLRAPRIYAVFGHRLLAARQPQNWPADDGPLVVDELGGTRREIPRPTPIGSPSDGLPSPDGRWLAVSFEHPAWPGPRQRMDVWLLGLRDLRWRHLPSMPVPARLKFTSMSWTPDGRLVLLGDFDEVGTAVAVWWPGQQQLAIRRLTLPARAGDSVLPW